MDFDWDSVKAAGDTCGASNQFMQQRHSVLKISDPDTISDELLPEYRFDYSKGRPNRFARPEAAAKSIKLDADVAAVFTTEEAVNTILRALIQAMPQKAHRETV